MGPRHSVQTRWFGRFCQRAISALDKRARGYSFRVGISCWRLIMTDILSVPVKLADGRETTLNEYKGKVVLVVNVASKCGLTAQYEGLEKLFEDKRERGFVIAAFPANNFKGQEPGTDAEIVEFCTLTYDVKFPIFSKISVKGGDKHPLYQNLTGTGL